MHNRTSGQGRGDATSYRLWGQVEWRDDIKSGRRLSMASAKPTPVKVLTSLEFTL